MVVRYVPEAGDIAWLDFDPQAGPKQGRRRPALVLTDQACNLASGLVVVCPHQQAKTVSFRFPRCCGYGGRDNSGGVDWKAGKAVFHSKADPALLGKVRTYGAVLLCIL
jgi:mRNA interferase MazF